MITLDVLTYNGSALPRALSATFDEVGGAIGRADSNQLVLPDPERTVSRVHAQVVFRNGGFAVIDRGSNPIAVNGRPLGNGLEAPLRHGDELQIGGYAIRVGISSASPARAAGAAPNNDPFADFGEFAAPAPQPAAASAGTGTDPLAAFGVGSSTHAAQGAPALPGGIPDDWDPFGTQSAARPAAPPPARPPGGPAIGGDFGLEIGAAAPAPLVSGLQIGGSAKESSLDQLFGLGPPSGGDPLSNSLLDAPIANPNMAAAADPMRSLNSATRASAESAADHLSELQSPFVAAPMAAPASTGGSAVLSWDDATTSQNRTVIRPKIAASVATPPTVAPAPVMVPPAPAAVVTSSAETAALAQALCEGLGMAALPGALTPESMRLIGELLREATGGTVELLIARSALKREVRADVTKIVARENNPLKFSPNVDVALNHLLGPPTRGFLAPGHAMRDAYDDLRAHQFGFLAGMRAALEGVLKRFDPALLESKLTQKSVLATLVPATRRARMWEVFQELYAQISAEAADDFHELFGKEFLRAYEAHIDELKKDAP